MLALVLEDRLAARSLRRVETSTLLISNGASPLLSTSMCLIALAVDGRVNVVVVVICDVGFCFFGC